MAGNRTAIKNSNTHALSGAQSSVDVAKEWIEPQARDADQIEGCGQNLSCFEILICKRLADIAQSLASHTLGRATSGELK